MSEKVLVRNAADKDQVKSAKQKEKFSRDRDLKDMKDVLSSVPGRRVVWRYLSECGVFQQSARDSGSWTYFNEGKRSVGLMLLADINEADPESYLKMLNESKKENE